jgi:hypothetical protein
MEHILLAKSFSPAVKNANGATVMDALFKISTSEFLDKRMKVSIGRKLKTVQNLVEEIESMSKIKYPPYYVEPILTVAESGDNVGGLGVLYARTIPVEINGSVQIVVELTAALLVYSTKKTLKLVLAHELLHYVELVRSFSSMELASQVTSGSIYEERYTDSSRAIDPAKVFSSKSLVRDLKKKTSVGLDDEKLNEKCRTRWIEKGLPVKKIPIGLNQVNISVEAIARSTFDPKVVELVSKT